MTSFLVFLAIIAAIVFWAIGIYNRLINERNRVRNAFAQIDVQLTRRHDLIPNLVEAVKGYMKHERETLEAVIKARNAAQSALDAAKADPANAAAIKELGASEGALGAVLAPGKDAPAGQRLATKAVQHGRRDLLGPGLIGLDFEFEHSGTAPVLPYRQEGKGA